MAASITLNRSVPPFVQGKAESTEAASAAAAAPAKARPASSFLTFAIAYEYIFALGRRWKEFGKKFRLRSLRSNSNWVERKTSKKLSDLRKMY